jgi:hypothetical protein
MAFLSGVHSSYQFALRIIQTLKVLKCPSVAQGLLYSASGFFGDPFLLDIVFIDRPTACFSGALLLSVGTINVSLYLTVGNTNHVSTLKALPTTVLSLTMVQCSFSTVRWWGSFEVAFKWHA